MLMAFLALVLAPPATAEGSVAKQKDPPQMVCRLEYPLGSRIPERSCKRRAEWDAIAQRTRDELRDIGRQNGKDQ